VGVGHCPDSTPNEEGDMKKLILFLAILVVFIWRLRSQAEGKEEMP